MAEKRKRIAALQLMEEEKKKLAEEEEKLKQEQEKLAKLTPSSPHTVEDLYTKLLELGELPNPKGIAIKNKTGKKVRINTRRSPLKVRTHPDTRSTFLAQIPSQSVVPFLQENKNWYQIEYQQGKKGWITKSYSILVDAPAKITVLKTIMPVAFDIQDIRVLRFTLELEFKNTQDIPNINILEERTIHTAEKFFKRQFYNDTLHVKERLIVRL